MKDEIKEILSYLKKKENTRRIKCITIEESKQLLDYITNLQQENHELKSKLECYENGAYYSSKVDELEQENERLKERIAYLERSNDRREDTILGLRQEISDVEDCNDELKKKLDKTLEVLQYELQFQTGGCYHRLSNLFDYLQNGSDDND